MKVWVIMGNDYPDAVFDSKTEAEAYCTRKTVSAPQTRRKIYWRAYEFTVQSTAQEPAP